MRQDFPLALVMAGALCLLFSFFHPLAAAGSVLLAIGMKSSMQRAKVSLDATLEESRIQLVLGGLMLALLLVDPVGFVIGLPLGVTFSVLYAEWCDHDTMPYG